MTIKKNYLAGLKDIISLQIACSNCSCIVSVPLDWKRNNIPLECPTCDEKWIIANSQINEKLRSLVASIKDVIDIEKQKVPFSLAVEFIPPSDSD